MGKKLLISIYLASCITAGVYLGNVSFDYFFPNEQSHIYNQSEIIEQIDYWDPSVRSFAVTVINPEHGGTYNLGQVFDIWDDIRINWVYVNEPRGEKYQNEFSFTKASKTIDTYYFRGDCDDFATVLAASIHAIGGTARIMVEKDTNMNSAHAYALVYIGNDNNYATNYIIQRYSLVEGQNIWYLKDTDGYWLNLDWQANYPGGPFWVSGQYRQVLSDIRP
jgi:transglutaminase-like putative cysteine protease